MRRGEDRGEERRGEGRRRVFLGVSRFSRHTLSPRLEE
jgi:hypothetical protein